MPTAIEKPEAELAGTVNHTPVRYLRLAPDALKVGDFVTLEDPATGERFMVDGKTAER